MSLSLKNRISYLKTLGPTSSRKTLHLQELKQNSSSNQKTTILSSLINNKMIVIVVCSLILTQPSEGVLNSGYDNVDSDYILRVGDPIITPEGKVYEIIDLMGKGTFGQVVKCIYKNAKELVAIKVIKNKKAFKNQGVIEVKILDILNRVYDPNGESPIVRMYDFFVFRDHLCIVFELLSESLYDLLRDNQFQGFSLNFSRLLISNILEGMKTIKQARLIHCDLKPENILFKSKDNPNLKIIDVGSACFEGYAIFQYIQSRYYRSPEVIMGLPYDQAIDMWSLGCICAELFLGIPLFPGNSEYDQLSRIIEIVGLPPQNLISKCRNRDKYFVFNPETMTYKLRSFDDFQITNKIRLELPKKYIQLNSLDDLRQRFIQKATIIQYEKAIKEGKKVDANTFRPDISHSEFNSFEAFIDFLKGILQIDKDQRWTPRMAMEHPFIKRETFYGHFDPQRENERNSSKTNETGEETMSEISSSSKDSKEYKYGSCPSKILYPQTATLPQYLQHQQVQTFSGMQQPHNNINPDGSHPSAHSSSYSLEGNDNVYQVQRQFTESHRPPILCIPDEFFKGFMFGRLDQILSMTKDQLYQFIYEQNEIAFRQQAQKFMMMQQRQQQMAQQQYQQQMMMNQNLIPNQNFAHGTFNPIIPGQQVQEMNTQRGPQQMIGAQSCLQNMPQMSQQYPGQISSFMQNNPNQQFIMQQMNFGPAQFVPCQNQIMNPPLPHQTTGPGMLQQKMPPQKVMMPPDQIIFNPPPYIQQKQQLYLNAAQMNDPVYQQAMLQQQKRFQAQRQGQPGGQGPQGNKGKAGSWQPRAGMEAQKYNQVYNQINNPGQIIGRPMQPGDFGQFFNHQQFMQQHQQTKQHQKQEQSAQEEEKIPAVGSMKTSDFKKKVYQKKTNKVYGSDQVANSVIGEEKSKDEMKKIQGQNLLDQQYSQIGAESNLQIQNNPLPEQVPVIDGRQDSNQFIQIQKQFRNQPNYDPQQMISHLNYQNLSQQKPPFGIGFPSPKFQQQDPNSFIQSQKRQSFLQSQNPGGMMIPQQTESLIKNASMTSVQLNMQSSRNSFLNQSIDSQNQSFQSIGGENQTGVKFLQKFEQSAAHQRQQSNTQVSLDQRKQMQNHLFVQQRFQAQNKYQKPNQSPYTRNRSNSDQIDEQLSNSIISIIEDKNQDQTQISQDHQSHDEQYEGQQQKATGFEALREQIKKQGLNASPQKQIPQSAKQSQSQSFVFDQFDKPNTQNKQFQPQNQIPFPQNQYNYRQMAPLHPSQQQEMYINQNMMHPQHQQNQNVLNQRGIVGGPSSMNMSQLSFEQQTILKQQMQRQQQQIQQQLYLQQDFQNLSIEPQHFQTNYPQNQNYQYQGQPSFIDQHAPPQSNYFNQQPFPQQPQNQYQQQQQLFQQQQYLYQMQQQQLQQQQHHQPKLINKSSKKLDSQSSFKNLTPVNEYDNHVLSNQHPDSSERDSDLPNVNQLSSYNVHHEPYQDQMKAGTYSPPSYDNNYNQDDNENGDDEEDDDEIGYPRQRNSFLSSSSDEDI